MNEQIKKLQDEWDVELSNDDIEILERYDIDELEIFEIYEQCIQYEMEKYLDSMIFNDDLWDFIDYDKAREYIEEAFVIIELDCGLTFRED